jgi:hypothetical protein
MSIKYTDIFHCKTLQRFTQIRIFGLKICHLATLHLINTLPERTFASNFDFDSVAIATAGTPELPRCTTQAEAQPSESSSPFSGGRKLAKNLIRKQNKTRNDKRNFRRPDWRKFAPRLVAASRDSGVGHARADFGAPVRARARISEQGDQMRS